MGIPVGNPSSLTFHRIVTGMKVTTMILLLIQMQLLTMTDGSILKITVTPILVLLPAIPVTVGMTVIATASHQLLPLLHLISLPMHLPVTLEDTMIPPLSITNQHMFSVKPTLIRILPLSFLRDLMNMVDYLIRHLHAGHHFSERGMFS